MKLAFATDGVWPSVVGGMARHSYFLVDHLARLGTQVEVFHPGPERYFDRANVGETLVPWPRLRFPGHYLVEAWLYSRRVARAIVCSGVTFDVAYAQGLSLWSLLGRAPFPIVVNPHGLEMFQDVGGSTVAVVALRRAMATQIRRADVVISLGGRLTGIIRAVLRGRATRVEEISNGIDLSYIDSLAPSPSPVRTRFVFVGRLAFNKGLPELLQAFAWINDRAELHIVGTGPLERDIDRAAFDRVYLRGLLSDEELFELLSTAWTFVLPTKGEGMPTAIIEAMACRVPIVSTRVGAVEELVDERNGMLLGSTDPRDIYRALEHMACLTDNERTSLGQNSRMKVERTFRWDLIARRTEDVLRTAGRET